MVGFPKTWQRGAVSCSPRKVSDYSARLFGEIGLYGCVDHGITFRMHRINFVHPTFRAQGKTYHMSSHVIGLAANAGRIHGTKIAENGPSDLTVQSKKDLS